MALEAAGPHTVFAEWQEMRPGLPLEALKSPACSISVIAGPPAQVEVCILAAQPSGMSKLFAIA
jgi:hypothetical protein